MGKIIMAYREKDQADFDLETFVDLFDTAMSSDNPAVKRALKNLILISALVDAKSEHEIRVGPLRRLVEDIKHLNQRLQTLEMEKSYKTTYTPPTTGTWPPGVVQPLNPATPMWPQTAPNTVAPSAVPGTGLPPGAIWSTSSSNVASTAQVSADSLLEKLEIKVQ
jgi:hypothetical protein